MQLILICGPEAKGMKAHDWLHKYAGFSRLKCKKIRLYGSFYRNGEPYRMIDPLDSSDELIISESYVAPEDLSKLRSYLKKEGISEASPLKKGAENYLLYQDPWFLIANKPANFLVHPNFYKERPSLTTELSDAPCHLVSRLDFGTSGLVLIARHSHAHYKLSHTDIRKRYFCLVHGIPEQKEGFIQAGISRRKESLIERKIDNEEGKHSITHFSVLQSFPEKRIAIKNLEKLELGKRLLENFKKISKETETASNIKIPSFSLIECELLTGRTHQIRLHLRHLGFPLLGETMYGLNSLERFNPEKAHMLYLTEKERQLRLSVDALLAHQSLHAGSLTFKHPSNDKICHFFQDFPQEVIEIVNFLAEISDKQALARPEQDPARPQLETDK